MSTESLVRLLDAFHCARVLVLGDVMLDHFVYGTATRISPEAPIPVVNIDRIADMPGGAANVARNVANLGGNAILLGVVGQDAAAADLRERLRAMPNIRACLVSDDSRPTTLKTRYVADGQQVMRADRESVTPLSADVARELLDAYCAAVADADLVVLSDYAKGVLSERVTRAAIDAARQCGKPVIVDPKSRDFARYEGATIITPNLLELQQACGAPCETQEQLVAGARGFIEHRICETLVVTRGKDGISVVQNGHPPVHLPTAARQVFDVSGAGDTVVAVLALGIVAGAAVVDAAYLANVAAGIVVGKRGTATVAVSEIAAALNPGDGNDPSKIFSLDSVQRLVRGWRDQGLTVAFTNGCFDLLHPGHISLLEQARRTADRLVVGLNNDRSISRLKGPTRPVQGEIARATVLAAAKPVDAVVIFEQDTPIQLIEALQPDVLVKGADYTVDTVVGADLVLQWGGKVVLAELLAGHSTSDTVKRVAGLSAL